MCSGRMFSSGPRYKSSSCPRWSTIFGVWLGGDEVEQRIREGFHHSVVASVRVCQHGGLGPPSRMSLFLSCWAKAKLEASSYKRSLSLSMDFFGPASRTSSRPPRDIARSARGSPRRSTADLQNTPGAVRADPAVKHVASTPGRFRPARHVRRGRRYVRHQLSPRRPAAGSYGNPRSRGNRPVPLPHAHRPAVKVKSGSGSRLYVGQSEPAKRSARISTKSSMSVAGPSTQADPAAQRLTSGPARCGPIR